MTFLSKELEGLLEKCVLNQESYPQILREELQNCEGVKEERLLSQIKALIDGNYLSSISWADNLPYYGRIEQKAFDYFQLREIYIRAKLRQDSYFDVLDEECELELRTIIMRNEPFVTINDRAERGRLFEHLNRCGYIKLTSKGVSYDMSGNFVCVASLTQKGYRYFEDKEARIEEILLLGDTALVVNNIENQFIDSLNGNTITNSPFQIGNDNELNFQFDEYGQKLEEFETEIKKLALTMEQTKVFVDLISEAKDSCKNKKASTLKKVLTEIWEFAKATGSGLLTAYLSMKFGLN